MIASTILSLPARPWCLPPRLCIQHGAPSHRVALVHAQAAGPIAGSIDSQALAPHALEAPVGSLQHVSPSVEAASSTPEASAAAESTLPASPGSPAAAAAAAAAAGEAAAAPAAAASDTPKPAPSTKRVPWNKGRKHLPGTIDRIKQGNAAALMRPEVQAKLKAAAEARRGTPRPPSDRGGTPPRPRRPKTELTPEEQEAAREATRQRRAEATRRLWADPEYRAKQEAKLNAPEAVERRRLASQAAAKARAAKAAEKRAAQPTSSSTNSSTSSSSSSKGAKVRVEVLDEDGQPLLLTSSTRASRASRAKQPSSEPSSKSSSRSTTKRSSSGGSSSSRKKKEAASAEEASTEWGMPVVGSGRRPRGAKPSSASAPATTKKCSTSSSSSSTSGSAAAAKRKEEEAVREMLAEKTARLVGMQQQLGQITSLLESLRLQEAQGVYANDPLGAARAQQVAEVARQGLPGACARKQELELELAQYEAVWDTKTGQLLSFKIPQLPLQPPQPQQQQHLNSSSAGGNPASTVGTRFAGGPAYSNGSNGSSSSSWEAGYAGSGHPEVDEEEDGELMGAAWQLSDARAGIAGQGPAGANGASGPLSHAELLSAAAAVSLRPEHNGASSNASAFI